MNQHRSYTGKKLLAVMLQSKLLVKVQQVNYVLCENSNVKNVLNKMGFSFEEMDGMDKQYLALYLRNVLLS